MFEFGSHAKKFYIILEGRVAVQVPKKINEETTVFVTVAELAAGEAFGELALIKDTSRAASILCLIDSHFAVLTKADYLRIIGKAESRILEDFVSFLRNIPIFNIWSKKKMEKIIYFFKSAQYKREQLVFEENSPASYVYIVKKGEFELKKKISVKNGKYPDENINFKAALLGIGEVFGEKEVLQKKNFSVSCSCYSTTGELLCITAENFLLKFNKSKNLKEIIENRKEKYSIRDDRLRNFQSILSQPRSVYSKEKKTKNKNSERLQFVHRRVSSSKVSSSRYSPLTKTSLDYIKKRALCYKESGKIYFDLHSPLETGTFEIINKTTSTRTETEKNFSEMICHRPGGYYRANLKKPATFSKTFYNYNDKFDFF